MSDTNLFWLDADSNVEELPYNCNELKRLVEKLQPIDLDGLASWLGLRYKSMAAMLVNFTLTDALMESATQITLEQLISDPSSFEWTNVGTPIVRLTISDHGIDLVMMAINSSSGVVYVIIHSRPISFG